jgi:5-methyltetrahydrofolate--homocysteine methyltransferase
LPKPISERISLGLPILFDGAVGSRLISMGLPPGNSPESWLSSHPDAILQLHREYVQAGAEVISSCTFGGNRLRLAKGGLDANQREINHKAMKLAKQASGGKVYVAADIGPTGEFFQPFGSLTESEALKVYGEQIEFLADENPDLFLLETFYDQKEAEVCLQACSKIAPEIPVAVTLTFNQTPKGFFTVMGQPAVEVLKRLFDQGAFLVGANCTLEAKGMLELVKVLTNTLSIPLLIQANAGLPELTPEGVHYPQQAEEFAEYADSMLKLGVRALGGCCGTEASHIAALRKIIDQKAR